MPYNNSVGFDPRHHGMKAEDAIRHAIGGATADPGSRGGGEQESHPGMTTYHGPEIEVSEPAMGVSVSETSGEDNYMDPATGERIGLSEKLQRSGSGASTSLEYRTASGYLTSLAHMSKRNMAAVKEQSLTPNRGGASTPIGNTSMGSTVRNVAVAGQGAVTKEGTYSQMGAVADEASKAGISVNPALSSKIAEGKAFQSSEPNLQKKGRLTPSTETEK